MRAFEVVACYSLVIAMTIAGPTTIKENAACANIRQECLQSLQSLPTPSLPITPEGGPKPKGRKSDLVCGSDGRTYANVCELAHAHCTTGRVINGFIHGPCLNGKNHRNGGKLNKGKQKKGGSCNHLEQISYNKELFKLFRSEYVKYIRISDPTKLESDLEGWDSETIFQWKFTTLDTDKDGELSGRAEMRELRQSAARRWIANPRRCGKTLTQRCDSDEDRRLSLDEWLRCLRVHSDPAEAQQIADSPFMEKSERNERSGILDLDPESNEGKEHLDATDCLSERRQSLELQRQNPSIFVPECLSDGRYRKIQCYNNTGYCWCVREDNGLAIAGTSIKDREPQCDSAQIARPMQGCPEPKKNQFLLDLMSYFTKQSNALNRTQGTLEEHIGMWSFKRVDKNKNNLLERKEWRGIRILLSPNKELRRCGKRLPRYCDQDNSKTISYTEWLACLNATSNSSPLPKRKGSNPLDQYLKPEDS